jgi:hypothetical protein
MQEDAVLHSFLDLSIQSPLLRIALLRSHEFCEHRRKEGRAVFWPLMNLYSRVYRATNCFGIKGRLGEVC